MRKLAFLLAFFLLACDDDPSVQPDADVSNDADLPSDSDEVRDSDVQPDADDSPDAETTPDADEEVDDSHEDFDGDGLTNGFEREANNETYLDWTRADTDGDGTSDADEDPDGDGLTNLEEQSLRELQESPAGTGPHPLRLDLLVELDSMNGRRLSDAVLAEVVAAYDALPLTSDAGMSGVGLQIYRDEEDLEVFDLDGSFEQRHQLFADYGPTLGDGVDVDLPLDMMIHVIVASIRRDDENRGGDTVADEGDVIENTGVLIYWDALNNVTPFCRGPDAQRPEITLQEALAATFVHELGHTLQVGHDTEVGGGINYFNIMSVPTSCSEAQMRFHGYSNHDDSLGNTEDIMAPRFSTAAADLIHFDNILSVHTGSFEDDDGYEM